jgi:hypothetical protein
MEQKTGYEPAFKTLNFGVMKATGNGQQNQIREKLLLSENILMQESGQQFYQKRR